MYRLSEKEEPNVAELAAIIDNTLSSQSSYGKFHYGLGMTINLGFLPNHRLMKRQIMKPLLEKLELARRGEFGNYAQIYEGAICHLKYYLYNIYSLPHDGNRIPTRKERYKPLDFMLDFTLITALSEYPLINAEPGTRVWGSCAALYLMAITYAARSMTSVWRGIPLGKRPWGNMKLFNSLNSLEKELAGDRRSGLKSVSKFSELVNMAGGSIDEKLPQLRGKILKSIEIVKPVRKTGVVDQLTKLVEKADRLYEVMQMSGILPNLYREFLKT